MEKEVKEMISKLSAEEASEVITEIAYMFGMEFTTKERCKHAQRGAIHLMREHPELSTPTTTSQSIWSVSRSTYSRENGVARDKRKN